MSYRYTEFPLFFHLLSHLPGKTDIGWTQAFAFSELAPEHLSVAMLFCVAVLPQTWGKLAFPLSQWPFYDLLDTSNLSPLLHSSQLVFSWWTYLLWGIEAIIWEHLRLPIAISTDRSQRTWVHISPLLFPGCVSFSNSPDTLSLSFLVWYAGWY